MLVWMPRGCDDVAGSLKSGKKDISMEKTVQGKEEYSH